MIVSNRGANATASRLGRGVITVVPVTTNVARVYPFQVRLPGVATGLLRDSKAQAEQVKADSILRVGARVGTVPATLMAELNEVLRLYLAL